MNKKKATLLWALLAVCAYGENSIDLGKSVIYSTTGFATEMREVAANPTIVTSEKIEEKDYKTVLDILEDIPSVSITKDTFGSTVDLRGQGSAIAKRNVQILIDGVAVNSLDTSMTSTPINTIPVSSIERIEVIPGGGSVLYGSGTAGGVINIITKRGKGLRADVAYDYSSFGGNKYDVSAGQSFGKFDTNVIYSKTDSDGYRDDDHDDTEFFQGNLKYNISDRQSLEFKYSNYDSTTIYSGMLSKTQLEEDRKQAPKGESTIIETKKEDYSITYNNNITDKLSLNIVGFQQETDMRVGYYKKIAGNNFYMGDFYDEKKGIKPKLKYSYGNEGSSVILGIDYIDNDAKRISKMMGNHVFNKETISGFIMNNYKFGKFEFNQGIRYEKSDYTIDRNGSKGKNISRKTTEDNFAFELSGNYLYSDTGKIYTRLEQGFTSPPPSLLTDSLPMEGYKVNDLQSEKYKSIEIGMSDYIGNTMITTSIFYTMTNDEIYTYMPAGMGTFYLNYNIDETERYGTEISLEHYFGKLTLSETYQYMHAEIKKGEGKTFNGISGDLAGRKIEGVPTHKFTLGAKYEFTPRFNINGEMVYTGSSYIENTNEAGKKGSYTVTNIRAGYTFDNGLSLYAGINNLFDKEYYDSIQYDSKAGYTYDPAAERNYYIGFRYSL